MAWRGRTWTDGAALRIVADEPVVASHEDALFVPGDRHGVFDRNGRLIVPATDFRSDGLPEGGIWRIDPGEHGSAEDAPDIPHVHGGPAPCSLADVLIRTLPRFWSRATSHGDRSRLLFSGGENALDRAFADPQILAVFAALGVARTDCVSYDRPVRIRSLVAPAPAFEAAAGIAHRAHRRTIDRLADRLAGPAPAEPPGGPPIHVSSGRFPGLDDRLRARGLRVVDPTSVALRSLVDLIRRAAVLSLIETDDAPAAALAFFAPEGTPVLLLRPDGVADVDAARLAATVVGHRGGVIEAITAAEDDAVASALAGAIVHAEAMLGFEAAAAGWSAAGDGTPGAVAGTLLSGTARMRTGRGQRPWWSIDLGRPAPLRALRVHGPIEGPDRPGRLRVLASQDGRSWTVLATRDDDAPVGNGLVPDGPWNVPLAPGVRARHVRIQSMRTGVLALDQVEISIA